MTLFQRSFVNRCLVLVAFLIGLLGLSHAYCFRPKAPCTSCSMYTRVRSKTDCRQYYVCYNGYPIKFRCPTTLVFSVSVQTCVSENDPRNDCDVRPYDFSGMYDTKTPWPPNSVPELPKKPTCGVKIDRRIVGGLPASPGEWPWMIALQTKQDGYEQYFCGAALINDQWLVTAGHCVAGYPRGKMTAIMGMNRLFVPSPGQIRRGIMRVLVHHGFVNNDDYPNDIALLQLADKVDLEEVSIGSVCLPQRYEEFEQGSCWVTGWGKTTAWGQPRDAQSNILNELRVSLVSRNTCRNKWGTYISSNHICVGNGEEGVCKGDSGSPLVCFRRGSYVLAGITSWGSETCNTPNFPNVYTRVSAYVDWINSQIRKYTPPVG